MALDPSLGCQDVQYSHSSGFPQPHGLRNTYDSPLSNILEGACSTSRRISLQLLHDRAKMYSKDNTTMSMERSSSSASRLSLGAIKRSVPGMKALLPLKLLSPTLPEFDTWPSPEPTKRSTFGRRIISQDIEYSSIGDRARDSLKSRKRSQQYRDTPIYSEPGSPVPSRAYFSENDVCFNCSQPGSICDADELIQDFVALKGDKIEDNEDEEDDTEGTPCTVKCVSEAPSTNPTPRWSELSFQCSGEALYENESVWLRSPMSKNSSVDEALADDIKDNQFAERTVESWLSDTSSSFDHEDEILACATALSPSKAQVIDLSVNPNHPSDLSLRIPTRSSSLMGTSMPENNFWATLGTPPITPSGPWNHHAQMASDVHETNTNTLVLSKRRLDLSLPSPPQSPHRSPAMRSADTTEPAKMRENTHFSTHNLGDQWPLSDPNMSQPLLTDIIGSLEALTSSFPSAIILPDSPCITAIRTRNIQSTSPPMITVRTSLLKSPFGQDFPRPPSYQPTGQPRSQNTSSHRRDFSSSTAGSLPPYRSSPSKRSSSLPISTSPSCLYPPDLSPLHRIFPTTSDFMCSALYAHIIAHIFITSLSPPTQKARTNRFSGRRRDTPHWTSSPLSAKAANVLGIEFQDSDPTGDSAERQLQFKIRIQALQQILRKCIYCLTGVMDSNLGIVDITELDDSGPGFSNGKLFIRALEEVVKSCEERNNGIGGTV
ncbi:uncharacterized protein LY89DRAFT_671955 [Mollisia scopiformis]|uniref:Uncharacterized protein n=1 Tax=Mollisia scopiformis TaxID=149040 RepID=A0A194X1C6_MOLSC|nr:uncharacterized protein LY89DRAFT_671955 [Mollisia scopiformis]KUJ13657.1 hypothetical protein LY89DRAFT_671955 [Mollisia scopiformis]